MRFFEAVRRADTCARGGSTSKKLNFKIIYKMEMNTKEFIYV